jgi:formylglycine-generating enzyme required for sulfatase activity
VSAPDNRARPEEAGYRILHPATGIEMVYVPGGTFMMGTPEDGPPFEPRELREIVEWGTSMHSALDQKPQHRRQVEALWIGRTEVTVAQWRTVMGTVPPAPPNQRPRNDHDDHPVVWIPRDDIGRFCSELGVRLPTEAEWEYAAAGPDSREFP